MFTFLEHADVLRRTASRAADRLGWAPQGSPSQVIWSSPAVDLRLYNATDRRRLPVLIVPAPIKRSYIWDLRPRISAVQRLLQAGFNVLMMDWRRPGLHEQQLGLDQYADTLIDHACNLARQVTGRPQCILAGHSLGGTLAALYAAAHPRRVAAMLLIESPTVFGSLGGAIALLVQTASLPTPAWTPMLGANVPGTWLNLSSTFASPTMFAITRWIDRWASLADPDLLRTHLLAERWMLDESPMSRRLFEELVEKLYRKDQFRAGTLALNCRRLQISNITAPVLSISTPLSDLVPPESIQEFHHQLPAPGKILSCNPDLGTALQHIAPLIGRRAHRQLWPEITAWLHHANR